MPKKKEELKSALNGDTPLEKLLLDVPTKRYPLIRVAVDWALVIKRKQENMHLRKNEILSKALSDVLSGRVDVETIAKELKAVREADSAEPVKTEAVKPKAKPKPDDEEKTPKKKSESKS
ncbi:MAG: hypothetical protein HY747_02595 [Elusimicrobia bacterium]|nr:hypothetical protein [Elusimicrobiota bacterium]